MKTFLPLSLAVVLASALPTTTALAAHLPASGDESSDTITQRKILYAQKVNQREKDTFKKAKKWNFNISIAPEISPNNRVKQGKRKWKRSISSLNFAVGWVKGIDAPEIVNNQMRKSYEWYLDVLDFNFEKNHNTFTVGTGFRHMNFRRSSRDGFFTRNADGYLTTDNYPEGSTDRYTRIIQNSNYIKLKYARDIKKWTVSAQALGHYYWRTKMKTNYTERGRQYTIHEKNAKSVPFGVTGVMMVSYQGVGLYVSYTPTKFLKFGDDQRTMNNWGLGFSIGF